MSWVYMILAILCEVSGTLALRMASQDDGRRWLLAVVAGYVTAFVFLGLTLDGGLAVGVVYGIWAASGVALTALASRVLFDEPLTKVMGLGIALIVAGVLTIELSAAH